MPKKEFSKKNISKAIQPRKKIARQKKNETMKAKTEQLPDEQKIKKSALSGLAVVRGMRDVIPPRGEVWVEMNRVAENIAAAYGFQYFETPVVEQASLFIRSLGRGSDVVDKEMYIFEDRDGGKICLRPEMTASVVRAYIIHGLHTLPQPVKVWYFGPMFRYDRPQAGRYREFHQFGCEIIGEKSPVVDAELISLAYNFIRDLGISAVVHINNIGLPLEREQYIIELTGYLRAKRVYLCENCKRRLTKNTLRVLDCKQESCQIVIGEAPQILDWLSEESKNFFMQVLEYLDELGIPYVFTPTLVRGLDYYTNTVFEFYEESVEEKSQNAFGGGGRYDPLFEQLGGQPTAGAGFALGLERIATAVEQKQAAAAMTEKIPATSKPSIFFAQLGEQARKRALFLMEELRRDSLFVYHNFAKSSLKAQLEAANKFGVTHTLILGQKEVQDGTILIRNMESGIQEIIDQKKIKQTLRKILEG